MLVALFKNANNSSFYENECTFLCNQSYEMFLDELPF